MPPVEVSGPPQEDGTYLVPITLVARQTIPHDVLRGSFYSGQLGLRIAGLDGAPRQVSVALRSPSLYQRYVAPIVVPVYSLPWLLCTGPLSLLLLLALVARLRSRGFDQGEVEEAAMAAAMKAPIAPSDVPAVAEMPVVAAPSAATPGWGASEWGTVWGAPTPAPPQAMPEPRRRPNRRSHSKTATGPTRGIRVGRSRPSMNDPVQRYDKPTIYPTMVVGVGGMGSNTVRAVKRRFRNVWGGDQLPGMIQLLALDTEPLVNRLDQEPLFADEFAYMGKFDATRLVANLDQHPEIAQWWNYPSIPLGYIHNGAKQLRPIGRLCFFRNYVTFKQQLETKLANLDKIRDMEIAQNRGFPVVGNYQLIYVVSSLCGGTGAGMFLDVVHRIRAQVRNNARIVGIFFLPDVLEAEISSDLQQRRIRANAYAALKELNYFQETQKFSVLYPSEQRELPDTPYAPFDFIFLMGRTNRDGRSLARKSDAENMAAHLIQLTAISHLSSEILGLEVNVVRERMFELESAAGLVTGERMSRRRHFLVYSSFAASALVAPHESLVDFWQRAFVADLVRRFAAGPSLSDPRQPLPEADRQRVLSLWQTLHSHLSGRFAALDNDRLDSALEEIEEQQGTWHGFWEPIRQTMTRVLMDTGIRGAIALCDLLSPPTAATAPPEALLAPTPLPRRRRGRDRGGPRPLAQATGAARRLCRAGAAVSRRPGRVGDDGPQPSPGARACPRHGGAQGPRPRLPEA